MYLSFLYLSTLVWFAHRKKERNYCTTDGRPSSKILAISVCEDDALEVDWLIAFVFYGIGILSRELFRNILSITLYICNFSIYFCISWGAYLGPTYLDITIQSFASISCLHLQACMSFRSLPLFKPSSLAKLRCVTLAFFPAGGLVSFRWSAGLVTTPPPHVSRLIFHNYSSPRKSMSWIAC